MPVIAVDFGGTNIKMGIVEQGKVLISQHIPARSQDGIRNRLPEVEAAVAQMLEALRITLADCQGVGIAIPGIVHFDKQYVISINKKYDDAVTVNFQQWSQEAFGLPIVMDNDMNCAILGETHYGCAVGVENAVSLSFGTGMGTAAVINGKLLRGKHFQAGCLGGHLTVDIDGPLCTCGNRGCVEAHAATWAIPMVARSREGFARSRLCKQPTIDYKSVMECAELGDEFSRELYGFLLKCWGAGIVNLIHAYDPETVILSGGLMKEKDKILPHLEAYVAQYAWTPWGKVNFLVAENPDDSVLMGLCYLHETMIQGGKV